MQVTSAQDPEAVFLDNFPPTTTFERAIFISWYCSVGDCTFCYMSTQKSLITDPKKARRSLASILAEAIIIKNCGWNIEFVSGGYGGFSKASLTEILKHIHVIYGRKLWLNVGVLNPAILQAAAPYLEGVCASIETINPEIHKQICPSKPIEPYLKMFETGDKLGLKKAITIILGVGETAADRDTLKKFVTDHGISRITFYSLNPIKGTVFEGKQRPSTEYILKWIRDIRMAFPTIEIIAGLWVTKIEEGALFLKAGANAITKFPGIKLFNTKHAHAFEKQAELAGRTMQGTLTQLPVINTEAELSKLDLSAEQKAAIEEKLDEYLKTMARNQGTV